MAQRPLMHLMEAKRPRPRVYWHAWSVPRPGAARPEGGTLSTRWMFRTVGEATAAQWDWEQGAPDPRRLISVRRPASDSMSRHVPVRMHSFTVDGVLALESGLEYDLVRALDREREVSWIVAQPCRLVWAVKEAHIPDVLSVDAHGVVTIWDARPERRVDERFLQVAEVTRRACDDVGWRYEVFHGWRNAKRLNLVWLHSFRREPAWYDQVRPDVARRVMGDRASSIGELLRADDPRGLLMSTVWHMIWRGDLEVDLDAPLTAATSVRARTEAAL